MTSQEVTFSSGEITTNRDHTSNLCMLGLCLVVLGFFFPTRPPSALPPPGRGSATHLLRLCLQLTWTTSAALPHWWWILVVLLRSALGNLFFCPLVVGVFWGFSCFSWGLGHRLAASLSPTNKPPRSQLCFSILNPSAFGIKCYSNKHCFLWPLKCFPLVCFTVSPYQPYYGCSPAPENPYTLICPRHLDSWISSYSLLVIPQHSCTSPVQ